MALSDQEKIELFKDLLPAPSKIHVVAPRHEGTISLQGAGDKEKLLLEKGGLVAAVGRVVQENFEERIGEGEFVTLEVGDRVWFGGHANFEQVFKRGEENLLVADGGFISTYQKAGTAPPEEETTRLLTVGEA